MAGGVKVVDPRQRLKALASERGESLAGLSRLLGRSHAYLQQWIERGSPRVLAETDRRALAAFFGVPETDLGAPAAATWRVPRLDVAASAGPGAAAAGEGALVGHDVVSLDLARSLGLTPGRASIIRVVGDSMAPGLLDGDRLLVDETARTPDARGGVYVIRIGDALFVKRVRRGRTAPVVTSDNPAAPPLPDGAAELVGRAVWQMRAPV